jgi:hypothetical protein
MNFAFFENLSPDEAERYEARFLELGRAALPALVTDAQDVGVNADLSIESVAPVLEWMAALASTVAREPDPSVPAWIRASESYEKNLFDFDEGSNVLILRSAYYLGESFVRSHPHLTWAVGRVDTAPQGQPVVTGFAHSMELPVLLVTENLFARLVTDGPSAAGVALAVETWASRAS